MLSMKRVCAAVGLGLLVLASYSYAEAAHEARIKRVSRFYAAHYAGVFQLPVEVVEAIIEVESGWKPTGAFCSRGVRPYATDAGHRAALRCSQPI